MPKMKTSRSAAKRFKLTGSGRIKRHRPYASHLLSHKTRKRKRALRRIMQTAFEEAPRDGDPLFSVMHAAAPDVAQEMAEQLRAEFEGASVLVQDLVPAIVTHGGPGAMGLGYFVTNWEAKWSR